MAYDVAWNDAIVKLRQIYRKRCGKLTGSVTQVGSGQRKCHNACSPGLSGNSSLKH